MTKKMYTQPCCVSGDDCNAPAGYSKLGIIDYERGEFFNQGARLVCFACGDVVCENCSSVYEYYDYGKQIICDNCAKENDLVKPTFGNFANLLDKNQRVC